MRTGDLPRAVPAAPAAVCRLGPVDVAVMDRAASISCIMDRFERGMQTRLAFANTNLVNAAAADPAVASGLASFLILNDGIGLSLGARFRHGKWVFPDNLNGTDFTPALLESLPPGSRIFLYGARPHVVRAMAARLRAFRNLIVVGYADGYSERPDLGRVIDEAGADVVLVALGNPRQELWIAENAPNLDARLLVGVGALFDFMTGEVARAPGWVRNARFEWLYRLALEPRRLLKRYSWDIVRFLYVVASSTDRRSAS